MEEKMIPCYIDMYKGEDGRVGRARLFYKIPKRSKSRSEIQGFRCLDLPQDYLKRMLDDLGRMIDEKESKLKEITE